MAKGVRYYAVCLVLSLAAVSGYAQEADSSYSDKGAKQCLGCHDYGNQSPVHAMLSGAHGDQSNSEAPMAQRGCEDCHGPSANHTRSPTQVSPGVSFGPRWTASIATQDTQCLACHESGTTQHWKDALHMVNDLTCVTCHDVHQNEDKVLHAATQADVCTLCHKPQKEGIHALHEELDTNPVCTTCHNPHDDQSAIGKMLDNRSEGCRTCHDLVEMAADASIPEKATSYHKVMTQQDRTCLDCHKGIAHGPADAIAPMVPVAVASKTITLFYPGQSDSEWLLSEHPGSQPLRQGSNCQQCHRGEEENMGKALAGDFKPVAREISVSFNKDAGMLQISLDWEGSKDDADIAIMWGDGGSKAFSRGGCFAACHSDMPEMTRDRGQDIGKYLQASRLQQRRIGQPAILKDADSLNQMRDQGDYAELWRLQLDEKNSDQVVETAQVLSRMDWQSSKVVRAEAKHRNGRWHVSFTQALGDTPEHKGFNAGGKYTFGIALHGADGPGGKHWVSLPMTLRFSSDDADFRLE